MRSMKKNMNLRKKIMIINHFLESKNNFLYKIDKLIFFNLLNEYILNINFSKNYALNI